MYKAVIIHSKFLHINRIKEMLAEMHPEFTVIYTFMHALHAIEDALKLRPDVIISDFPANPENAHFLIHKINTAPYPIHLIFYSENRSFESVRQALLCNATAYITPGSASETDEMNYALTRIKNQLDRRKKQRKQTKLLVKLLSSSRKQFLTDIFVGNLSGQDTIMAKAKELNLAGSTDIYCPFWLKIPEYNTFINTRWKYDKERFLVALGNFLHTEDADFEILNIRQTGGEILYIAISASEDATAFVNALRLHLQTAAQEMHEVLDLKALWHIGKHFMSLQDLVAHISAPIAKSESANEAFAGSAEESSMYERYKNVLFSALLDKTPRLKEHLTFILRQIVQETNEETSSVLIDFCRLCAENLAPELLKEADFVNSISALSTASGSAAIGIACNLLYSVCRKGAKNVPKSANDTLVRAEEYIKRNYRRELTLESVAKYLELNPSYFSRYFKEKTGQNFRDYLISLRVEKAKELLLTGRYKIFEISSMTGYKNSKYFAAQFKEITGQTPRDFAKTNGKKAVL